MVKKKTCILCSTSVQTMSYFKFPTDKRRKEWLRLCKITCEIPKTAVLCAKHFSSESFSKNPLKLRHRHRLKLDAMPSEYLNPVIDDEIRNSGESRASVALYRWCFICGSVNDPQRSIHRFPKNVEDQNVWLSKCGRRQSSSQDMNNLRLCSLHFSSDSFVGNPQAKKRSLKPGAVPIDITETESTSYINMNDYIEIECTEETETSVGVHIDELPNVIATPMEVESNVAAVPLNLKPARKGIRSKPLLKDNDSSTSIPSQSTSDNVLKRTSDKACQTEDDLLQAVTNTECCEPNAQPFPGTTPITSCYDGDLSDDHSCTVAGTNKTVGNPRYVGAHLASPNHSKRCQDMTKKVIDSKNQIIASLSRKLRFTEEKLRTLNDLITHLRDTQSISETVFDELMVCAVE